MQVCEYLQTRETPYGYIRVSETHNGTKYRVVGGIKWSTTNKTFRSTDYSESIKNRTRQTSTPFVEGGTSARDKRTNEYITFDSTDVQVLDIDDQSAFETAYPDIAKQIDSAPHYLSRNKRLKHVFIEIDWTGCRKRKRIEGGGCDWCAGQSMWVRAGEMMVNADVAPLKVSGKLFAPIRAKKKSSTKSKKAPAVKAKAATTVKKKKKPSVQSDATVLKPEPEYMDTEVRGKCVPTADEMAKGLNLISLKYIDSYESWMKIGTILKKCYDRVTAYKLFEEFSRKSAKYPGRAEVSHAFDNFNVAANLHFATICYYIKQSVGPIAFHKWRGGFLTVHDMTAGDRVLADYFYTAMGCTHFRITDKNGAGYVYDDNKRLWVKTCAQNIANKVGRFVAQQMKLCVWRYKQDCQENDIEISKDRLRFLQGCVVAMNTSQKSVQLSKLVWDTPCYDPDFRAEINSSPSELPIAGGFVLCLKTGATRLRTPADLWSFELDVSTRAPENKVAQEKAFRFFQSVCKDDNDICTYLLEVLGFSMTGRTDARTLWILYGSGRNGKSTCMNLMQLILKDMYAVLSESALIDQNKSSGGATPELMCLQTARCGVVSEIKEGSRLDAKRVKWLTGNEAITCRALYQDPVTFIPKTKCLLLSNHLPGFDSLDTAMTDRVRVIPFLARFNATKENGQFVRSLEHIDVLNEIFRLLVNSCIAYYERGELLPQPKIAQQATQSCNKEQDTVGMWLTEETEECDTGVYFRHDAFTDYEEWVADSEHSGLTKKKFFKHCAKKGLSIKKKTDLNTGKRSWAFVGIRRKESSASKEQQGEEDMFSEDEQEITNSTTE